MRLECSNGPSIDDPDDAAIARAIEGLGDTGDAARLHDPTLGEIRAAGPAADGTFHLQCALPATRTGAGAGADADFEGERSAVPRAEVVALFERFRRGDTGWRTDFEALGTPLFPHGRHRIAVFIMAVILFILAALWRAV
jgi:hypothetical protein